MIILVEGPDGAGKTELINKLLRSHPDSSTLHFGAPKTQEEEENYWMVYMRAISETDPNKLTLFDRCWYSDLVYAPVMRGKPGMDMRHVKMLEKYVIASGGGHVVHCTANIHVLWARCQRRGEDYVTEKSQLEAIAKSYEDVLTNKCTLPVIRYDTSHL